MKIICIVVTTVFLGFSALTYAAQTNAQNGTNGMGNTTERVTIDISARVMSVVGSSLTTQTQFDFDAQGDDLSKGASQSVPFYLQTNSNEPYLLSTEAVDNQGDIAKQQIEFDNNGATSPYQLSLKPCGSSESVELKQTDTSFASGTLSGSSCKQAPGSLTIELQPSSRNIENQSTGQSNVNLMIQAK